MRYLITGGCGFIGVNFAEHLLEMGHDVTLLDNLSRTGSADNLAYIQNLFPQVRFLKMDLADESQSAQDALLQEVEKVDVVHHLAGQVAVTTSILDPRADFISNALGTLNILEAVRQSSSQPILIYASTNKVYGGMEEIEVVEGTDQFQYTHLPQGIPETQLLDFHSPYGCSKGAADQYVRDYARIYGLKTVVMRQSCIYGTRQFGVEDQGWVAWFAIASLLGKPITIYGNGKQVRDVLYVDDLFEAWQTVEQQIDVTAGQIFNVGGGVKNTLSLLKLIEMLEKKLGKKLNLKFDDWRAGDQPVYVSDIGKIQKETGWEPKTSVEEGVSRLLTWVEENKNLFQ